MNERSELVVGSCALKEPPTRDGTVDIAYYKVRDRSGGALRRLPLPSPPVLIQPRIPPVRTRLKALSQLPTAPTLPPAPATPETIRRLALSPPIP